MRTGLGSTNFCISITYIGNCYAGGPEESVGIEYGGGGHMRTGKVELTGKTENWVGVIMGNRHGPVAGVCPKKPRQFDISVTQSPMRCTLICWTSS